MKDKQRCVETLQQENDSLRVQLDKLLRRKQSLEVSTVLSTVCVMPGYKATCMYSMCACLCVWWKHGKNEKKYKELASQVTKLHPLTFSQKTELVVSEHLMFANM